MSILSSIGKITTSAGLAVAKTAARAVAVAPLIVANVVAKDAPIVKKATSAYGINTAIKDAGTTLSVASLAAGGIAAGTAVKAGTSVLNAKIVGSAFSAAAGSSLTTAPKTSEKVIKSAPSLISKGLEKAAENPTAAIATLAAVPLVAAVAVKAGGAAATITSNLISSKDNVTEISGLKSSSDGLLGKSDLIEDVKKDQTKPLSHDLPSSTALSLPATQSTSLTPAGKMTPITSKKPYKRRKPKEPIKVSQRVNIAIKNTNSMRRNIYKVQHR